jgi:hypothetical protein
MHVNITKFKQLLRPIVLTFCGVTASVKLSACSDSKASDAVVDSAVQKQLDMLRQAMSPFYSFDVAQVAGWNAPLSECVEVPELGGMGIHYGNPTQLDNGGALSLLRPEVLLYVPMADSSMELVAVEYIIGEADWPFAEAPEFLGQALHFNEQQRFWALHVWIGRSNPSGLFADFNPEVSCEHANEA